MFDLKLNSFVSQYKEILHFEAGDGTEVPMLDCNIPNRLQFHMNEGEAGEGRPDTMWVVSDGGFDIGTNLVNIIVSLQKEVRVSNH